MSIPVNGDGNRKSLELRNLMAGAEEEDDYMGDLSQFLPPEVSQSSSMSNSSSKKSKTQNWQEQRKLKRQRRQIEEDMQTLENLGSAIPESNIGFKLLKQMGYAPGSALGKEGSGRAEPVVLEIRRGRGGIGKEDPKVEKMRREKENEESMKRKEEELREEFGSRQKERWRERRIVVNFRKAEASLAQLEKRDIVDVEKKEEEDEKKEEEEEEITEEDLLNILLKLRNEFYYCLFCGCQYETMEALVSNCPGINEDDH
ncbi:G patch domain-containing protein 11 isoform X2 [Sesamum indicum]|uniref:G patch domain-containing protein 11 isoform X2 n=1 Tax=Sesamum indicum TaxID=4182 RepID=A0A8M8UZ53_SESIN|nr:G patch domain-containing protein 11 isoform X2 [Sesamum indicum]